MGNDFWDEELITKSINQMKKPIKKSGSAMPAMKHLPTAPVKKKKKVVSAGKNGVHIHTPKNSTDRFWHVVQSGLVISKSSEGYHGIDKMRNSMRTTVKHLTAYLKAYDDAKAAKRDVANPTSVMNRKK